MTFNRVELRDWVLVERKANGEWQFLRVDANCWKLLANISELWASQNGELDLPMKPVLALRGKVYYHDELMDGTPVMTAQIVKFAVLDGTCRLAITAGDAQYELIS